MQFRDKTAYVWGLRYRWDPSLSMNPVRQFAHFMPPCIWVIEYTSTNIWKIWYFFCLMIDAFSISEKKGLLVIVALFCTTYFGVATFFFFTWSPISLVIVADSWIVCCSAMRSQDKPKSDKLDRYCSCFFWVESYENFIVCTLCK